MLTAAPATMRAAVYTGNSTVSVEHVPTPAIGPGELLIRVESCGICHTDLKKIEYNLLTPPRIYGHETAGVVAATGQECGDSRRATASSSSTTSRAGMLLLPAQAVRAVSRSTRKSASRRDMNRPAADFRSTCASWIGSCGAAWRRFPRASPLIAPVLSSR